MRTMIFAAAVLAASLGSAVAAEGNGEPFANNTGAGREAVPAQVFNDTGSSGYIRTTRPITLSGNDQVLPQNGSESPIQTANSLPVGALEGTVAYAQASSVQRWVAAHQLARTRLAGR